MMNFRKTAIALTAVGALGVGTIGATQQAAATPAWVIPTIIAVGAGGLLLGASAHDAHAHGYYGHPHAHGVVTARPVAGCWIENRRGGPVEVCRR
jgi:hypothetical protein